MNLSKKGRTAAILTFAFFVSIILGWSMSSFAQQSELTLPLSVPRNQRQGGGVLEVPTIPGRQAGGTENIPRIAPQQGQELTLPSRQLARQPGYSQLTVTIVDQQGRYVTGLQKNDFNLYIDGQQRPIEFFRQDLNTPVSVGILADTSGSMEPKLRQLQSAITEFVNDLNPRDDVFLFAFSSQPFLLQPFTTDHQAVISRLSLLYAQGETAIFDTIIDGLLMVRHGRWDKKALLVVTDGQDNASAQNLQQVITYARQMGVLIYSIGIGNSNVDSSSIGFGPLGLGLIAQDAVDARTLEMLSNETGAKTFLLRTIGDGTAMREDCAAISRELREQYTLGFLASDPGRGGYRNVRVEVPSRPDDKVRVRKGVELSGTESASAETTPEVR
ncbi:MAG: VWA domain-containing protein [Deltaproteobacteria bacterium]|nr:VWA domain-containing protein [Deltaproteobacteria bacterium]